MTNTESRTASTFEWQPIETAPKDGTLILAHDANCRDTSKHARWQYGLRQDDDGSFYRGSQFEVICWIPNPRNQIVCVKHGEWKSVPVDWSHWARSQGSWTPTHWMPLPSPPTGAVGDPAHDATPQTVA